MEMKARASQERYGWWRTSKEKDMVGGTPATSSKERNRELELVVGATVVKEVGEDGAKLVEAVEFAADLEEDAVKEKLLEEH